MLYEIKIVHFLSCQSFTGQQYKIIKGVSQITQITQMPSGWIFVPDGICVICVICETSP